MPPITPQLAEIIDKRWSTRLSDAKQKEKLDKYTRRENCERLLVPRVNAEIWEKIDQKTRQQDLRASVTQKALIKMGAILAKSTELLLQSENKLSDTDLLITMNTDALALLGHTMSDLSQRRRDAIRPHSNKDYGSLCASQVPVTTLLFGDDLQARLNNIRASNRISQPRIGQANNKRGRSFLYKGPQWKYYPPR